MFYGLNKRGVITIALAGVIGLGVIAYIAAIYSMFSLSFEVRAATREAEIRNERNIALELNIQRRETDFARINSEVFLSMEKIATIKYLTAENVAVNK